MTSTLLVTIFHSRSGSTALCDYIANAQDFAGYQELFHPGNRVQSFYTCDMSFTQFMASLRALNLPKPLPPLNHWGIYPKENQSYYTIEEKKNISYVHFKVNVLTLLNTPKLLFYLLKFEVPIIFLYRDLLSSIMSSAQVYAGNPYHTLVARSKRSSPHLHQVFKASLVQCIQYIALLFIFVLFLISKNPLHLLKYAPDFLDSPTLCLFNSALNIYSSGTTLRR